MIAPVDPYLEAFAKAGADLISIHPEAGPHLHRSLQTIRALGKQAGVVLNPGTPETTVEPVLDLVDLVLCMTVNPGFGGQAFIGSVCEKVRRIRAMIAGRPIRIEIDGGVTPETAPLVAQAGADTARRGLGRVQGRIVGLRRQHRGHSRRRRESSRGTDLSAGRPRPAWPSRPGSESLGPTPAGKTSRRPRGAPCCMA